MKKLLDKLVARQGRLMAELAPTERPARAELPPLRDVSAADRAAEAAAIDAASGLLAEGEVAEALEVLAPFEERFADLRTLTMLSRLNAASGRHDDALRLLERASRRDPSDIKVAFLQAELLDQLGRHREAVGYRRRVAFWSKSPSASSLLQLLKTVARGASAGKLPVGELRMALDQLLAAPERTAAQTLEACQIVYGIRSMRQDALQLYDQTDACPPDHVEVDAKWLSLQAWAGSSGDELYVLSDQGRPGRRPQAARASEVVVSEAMHFVPLVAGETVVLSGQSNRALSLRHQSPASPLMLTSTDSCRLRLSRQRRRFSQPCVLVGSSGSYTEDFLSHVGSLAAVERLQLDQGRRIVVSQFATPQQAELLELLGYDRASWITLAPGEVACFDDLIIPTPLHQGGKWIDPMLVAWYRQRLAPLATGSGRKLYVSRRHATVRRVVNEGDVERRLKDLGFEVVRPSELTAREQIDLFAQASMIVGAGGGAMMHALFAPPGTRTFTFNNRALAQAAGASLFDRMADSCGHISVRIDCGASRLTPGSRPIDADLWVDVDALVANINA